MPQIAGSFVFRVKHFQALSGQAVLNVYHYRFPDLPLAPNSQQVSAAFANVIVPQIKSIQDASVQHELVEVELLGSLTNFGSTPLTGGGDLIGQDLANFAAMRFDYIRSTKETRSGAKRIAGINEEVAFGNSYDAAHFAAMEGVAVVLGNPLQVDIFQVEPVILGIRYVPDTDPPVPLPVSEWIFNPVTAVVANPLQSTQNTRKLGRGQ